MTDLQMQCFRFWKISWTNPNDLNWTKFRVGSCVTGGQPCPIPSRRDLRATKVTNLANPAGPRALKWPPYRGL